MNIFFWKIVSAEIKRQNTSYDWLARKTKISKGTFSSWKSRNNVPTVDSAFKIAQALNVSLEYLLTGVDDIDYASNEALTEIATKLACFDTIDLLAVKNLTDTLYFRYLKSSSLEELINPVRLDQETL
ncbi:MAG: helix-turn-helix domain-containing protein [Treponemataceae bacterium]